MTLPVKSTSLLAAAALMLPSGVLAAVPAPRGHAAVVSVQRDASDAGLEILKRGGNAIDAAVATGFALAVTFPRAGNLGGGGFMLIRMRSGKALFVDFRERAPLAATPNMYLDEAGNIIPGLSTRGYKAVGVPGSVKGLVYAQRHFGRLTLAQDMAPAIRLASGGVVLSASEAAILHNKNLTQFPESVRVFQRGGEFYKEGELFQQPDLARTLRRIAAHPDDFYRGAIASQLATDVQAHGGLITAADLRAYKVAVRKPLLGHFTTGGREYDIVTSPPPSSGGIVLLETLNMLSALPNGQTLAEAGADRSPGQVHLIAEAFRRAYKDRSEYLGDPDFNKLPIAQMGSAKYAAAFAASILPGAPSPSATLERPAGFLPAPPAIPVPKESTETTQYSVIDSHGNAVSTTYTLNGFFGCGATATGLGVVLNNEMDDFSSAPGKPNMFGLIQGPANAIGPGHRPLSSMTPTLVTTHAAHGKSARLILILGSPGGSTIPTTVANDLISVLVNGLTLQASADAPRFYHQYLPDTLEFEKAFPRDTVAALSAMGYKISQANLVDTNTAGVWGASELIQIDPRTRAITGATDPRYRDGKVSFY